MENNNKNYLEVVVNTKDLAHALSLAGSIVEKRNVSSGLSHIKISVLSDGLTISATDLDLYLNQTMGAKVVSAGQTMVSSQLLTDIVRKIADQEICIKQIDEQTVEIKSNNGTFQLLTLPVKDFPVMEELAPEMSFTLPCQELARILDYTCFAASTEETRYNLNGVYLHVQDGRLHSAATDGHRLSVAVSHTYECNNDKTFGVILPRKAVQEVLKTLKDSKNSGLSLEVSLNMSKIKFVCNNTTLISKLIDANFPDYKHFIPLNNESKLSINTKLLASSIDRVSTVTIEKFRAIKMHINNKKLDISAFGESRGAGLEQIEYAEEEDKFCQFQGDEVVIGFNPKYIIDILATIKEEKVDIYLKDATSPALLKTSENPDDAFVVMPVKV